MKVFIVEKYGGQYEDSWEYVDKVFDDVKKAEEYIESDKKIIKSFWENKKEFSELCDNILRENTDDKGYWKEGVDVADFKWLYSFENDDVREKQFLKVFNEKYPDYVKRFDTEYLIKMYHFLITQSNIYHEEPDDYSSNKINYRIIPKQVY
jgi:hypothetical protein